MFNEKSVMFCTKFSCQKIGMYEGLFSIWNSVCFEESNLKGAVLTQQPFHIEHSSISKRAIFLILLRRIIFDKSYQHSRYCSSSHCGNTCDLKLTFAWNGFSTVRPLTICFTLLIRRTLQLVSLWAGERATGVEFHPWSQASVRGCFNKAADAKNSAVYNWSRGTTGT